MLTNLPTYHNILLIQLRRIGDVLMTTPAIRAIRKAYPQAKIHFVTESPSNQILQHNPYLDSILLFNRKGSFWQYLKFLWELRQRKFDLAIDFFGNPRSAQMAWASGAKQRVGFDFPGRRSYYTDRVSLGKEEKYAVFHKLSLLEPLHVPFDSLALDFFIDSHDQEYAQKLFEQMGVQKDDLIVSLSPVSRQPYKVWPSHYFAQIADTLIEQFNAKILFIYGPGEEHFVESVREHMHQVALPNYTPPTLAQTKALFEKVDFHLGNDNGPCHFAIAAGIPTVAVFGKPKAINWIPPEQDKHLAVEFDPGCKNQCSYPQCTHLDCIKRVDPDKVKAVVLQVINQFQQKQNV